MRDVLADQGKSAVRLKIRSWSTTELARSCCSVGRSKNKHVYSYVHGYKAVFENPLLVTTDRFGPDGSISDSVVTENLDFAHGDFHLLVRFSVDQLFLGDRTLGSFFL